LICWIIKLIQAAAPRRDAIKTQQDGACDVQPLSLTGNPKAGLVQMLNRRRRHMQQAWNILSLQAT
jgi:hypothetical protein